MTTRLAYLGPPGTFTEEATRVYAAGADAELIPLPSFAAVASAVDTGVADEGIVAIENSLNGSVADTLDLLIHDSALKISHEVVIPIHHQLLAKPGTRFADIRAVISHPQALGQCRRFIERCLPKAQVTAALSTAEAVSDMLASDRPAAAIATLRAAELFDAEVLARNIEDNPNNVTRFVVLSAEDHAPTGDDRTSLCFAFAADSPGELWTVLGEFARRSINLSKLESRPTKGELGEYVFLLDLRGHRTDPIVAEALECVRQQTAMLKVFGSYPRAAEATH